MFFFSFRNSTNSVLSPAVDILGSKLSDVWPDPELSAGVNKVLEENIDVLTMQSEVKNGGDRQIFKYRVSCSDNR